MFRATIFAQDLRNLVSRKTVSRKMVPFRASGGYSGA